MANTRHTKRLIERKIIVVQKEVDAQQAIVDRLANKLTSAQASHDAALGKLNAMKGELADYKKDKVR